jgi:hypothetical protein
MAGLMFSPAIHALCAQTKMLMAGTSPAMTAVEVALDRAANIFISGRKNRKIRFGEFDEAFPPRGILRRSACALFHTHTSRRAT